MIVHKVVHKQTQNHQEHEEHASTLDMNKKSRKVHLHGLIKAIKAFTRLMSKRYFNVHSRLWTLENL